MVVEVQAEAGEQVWWLLQWKQVGDDGVRSSGGGDVFRFWSAKGPHRIPRAPHRPLLTSLTLPSVRAKESPPNSECSCGSTAGIPLYALKVAKRLVSRKT